MKAIDNFLKRILRFLWRSLIRLLKPSGTAPDPANGADGSEAQDSSMPEFTERRRFLNQLSLGLSGVIAVLLGVPFIGFLFSSEQEDEIVWRPIGPQEDFPMGETVKVTFIDPAPLPWAGFSARTAAWVRQDSEEQFVAFSVYCTHVGCPVRWTEEAKLFLCPCHGGSFYQDGSVAGGPPARALERYDIRVRDGQVEILARPQPLPT